MSSSGQRGRTVWSVGLAGGVTAAAAAVRAVAVGAALGLVLYWARGKRHTQAVVSDDRPKAADG